MSTRYDSYAQNVSDIIRDQARATADTQRQKAALWGGTLQSLGQIPGAILEDRQRQQALQVQAERQARRDALDEGRLANEEAITAIRRQELETKSQQPGIDPDALMAKKIESAGKLLKDADEPTWKWRRTTVLQMFPDAQLPEDYSAEWKQRAFAEAPKAADLKPIPGPDGKPVYGVPQAGQPVYEQTKPGDVDWIETIENGVRVKKAVPKVAGTVVPVAPPDITPAQAADDARANAAQQEVARHNASMERIAGLTVGRQDAAQQETARHNKAMEGLSAQGDKDKPASQAAITSAGYARRVDDAEQVIDKVQGAIGQMGVLSFAAQSRMPAAAQSTTFQQYDQAGRNFINAVLRRESGAAINASEWDNARKQYLPQPGDGPEVTAQKKQNRARAKQTLQQAAGSAYAPAAVDPLGIR